MGEIFNKRRYKWILNCLAELVFISAQGYAYITEQVKRIPEMLGFGDLFLSFVSSHVTATKLKQLMQLNKLDYLAQCTMMSEAGQIGLILNFFSKHASLST
jgi:hypothetical protein